MKVTMLAWSGQVASSSREQLMNQGNHKLQVVTDVYGRDETLSALRAQIHVLGALAPHLAQERGAMRPVLEPALLVDIFTGLTNEYRSLYAWEDQKRMLTPQDSDEVR